MIDEAILNGVEYLKKHQQKDGSFLNYSTRYSNFKRLESHNSPFYTALILSSLNMLKTTRDIDFMKSKASAFLLSQKSKNWSFNYWVKNSEEAKIMPYPDDLDVTFCALAALFQYDKKIVDGKVLAKCVELLTLLEKKEGGPYRTWLVNDFADPIWKDIDVAVNSNIAYFLSLIEVDLPNINEFIEKKFLAKSLKSPYYHTSIPVLYFISRFYKGKLKEKLINEIISLQTTSNWWGSPISTALAVSAIINLGGINKVNSKKIIHKLLSYQVNGAWGAAAFVIEKNKLNEIIYAGSKCLTTAFCLEALEKYNKASQSVTRSIYKKGSSTELQKNIVSAVQKRYDKASSELGKLARKMLSEISKMDEKNNITLLPLIFKEALGKNGDKITDELLEIMGEANLYGWIAYTIYDDFLDGEGKSEMLPVANIALREMTGIFNMFSSKNKGFEIIFRALMDQIDNANTYEIEYCRNKSKPPNYEDLKVIADKSIGIALTPAAMLFSLGYSAKSKEMKSVISFFNHYLVARQLNDDAHDWEEDLKSTHISPVVVMVINKSKNLPKRKLQEIFWYKILPEVCEIIIMHINEAKKSIKQIKCIEKVEVLEKLTIPIENAVKEALTEREKTIEFLASYKN